MLLDYLEGLQVITGILQSIRAVQPEKDSAGLCRLWNWKGILTQAMQAVWRSWRRQGNRLSPRASGNDGSPVDTRIPAQDPCQPRDYRMLHLCHRNHGKCSNCGEQQETKAVTYMQRFTGKGGLGQINIPGNESVPFL